MKYLVTGFFVFALLLTEPADAKRSKSSSGPGTGSKSSSTHVRGYIKKNGTYVAPSRRSTGDKTTKNNWSTKGNVNPSTGKPGTKLTPDR